MYAWAADVADTVNGSARYGVDGRLDGVRWSDIRDRVFGRIDPISDAGRKYRAGGRNTRVYEGTATFTGPRRLVVTAADGARTEISAERVVLANGSRPVIPAIPGLDPALGPVVSYVTNSEVMRIEALPKHVVILGGGYIACEFAHVFAAFGSQVTVISRSPELLRGQDETVTARFTELAQQHWDVRLAATAVSVAESAGEITVTLADGATVSGDLLLVAAGRIPNGDTLEAAAGGVNVTAGGRVVVDAQQRTSAAGVWALGDVSSDYLLKHAANHEARTVSHNLTHPDSLRSSDHRFVPAAVFTDPQIARVGMTEAEARSAGIDYAVKVQAYGDVAYGWAMEDRHGFVKVIAEKGTRRLLGAHLMGFQASTVIQPFIQALSLGTTDVRELARGQYWIHPALAEVVENALLGLDV
jgi:mycothione reductase